jgi:hypothetical protein
VKFKELKNNYMANEELRENKLYKLQAVTSKVEEIADKTISLMTSKQELLAPDHMNVSRKSINHYLVNLKFQTQSPSRNYEMSA